jgi:hypothetical protein
MGHVVAIILWVITNIWRTLYKRWRQPRITKHQGTQTEVEDSVVHTEGPDLQPTTPPLVTTQIAIDCKKIVTDQMKVHMLMLQHELIPLEERLLDRINSVPRNIIGDRDPESVDIVGLLLSTHRRVDRLSENMAEKMGVLVGMMDDVLDALEGIETWRTEILERIDGAKLGTGIPHQIPQGTIQAVGPILQNTTNPQPEAAPHEMRDAMKHANGGGGVKPHKKPHKKACGKPTGAD